MAQWDKMKINSPWHGVCAVCVPEAARSRRSLASGFSEVSHVRLLTGFLPVKYIFCCCVSYEDKYFSAFFSPRWVDGGGAGIAATNYPALTNQPVWAE